MIDGVGFADNIIIGTFESGTSLWQTHEWKIKLVRAIRVVGGGWCETDARPGREWLEGWRHAADTIPGTMPHFGAVPSTEILHLSWKFLQGDLFYSWKVVYMFFLFINKKSWNDFVMCTLSLCPISFEWKIILKKYSTFLAYFTWGEVWQFCPSQVYDTRSIPTSQKFFLGIASAVKVKIGSNSELGWFNLLKTDTAPVEIRIQLFRHESGG